MDNLKIKLWYLFRVNKKQFLWFYVFLSVLSMAGAIGAYYKNPVILETDSWLRRIYFNNDVVFWLIILLYTIIEAQFFWSKFNKEHIRIINEQNAELAQQKEEIASQKEEIETQRDQAIAQKEKIEAQNKQITDSILYAERIQKATLPIKDELNNNFENFILFKPRDIVSGDFYWYKSTNVNNEELIVLAAADCTGHGVPGAFVSMLGMSLLNEIVSSNRIKANEILEKLRSEIKKSLHQQGKSMEQQDGMDIALVVIDKKRKKIDYAGANNSLIICTKDIKNLNIEDKRIKHLSDNSGHLIEIKPDRMPIGIYTLEKNFTSFEFSYNPDDIIYMFSDGYIDQFGGTNRQKFMSKNFKKLILDNYNKPIVEQKKVLENTLTKWQGNNEQVDDILVMGIKL